MSRGPVMDRIAGLPARQVLGCETVKCAADDRLAVCLIIDNGLGVDVDLVVISALDGIVADTARVLRDYHLPDGTGGWQPLVRDDGAST